MAKTRAQLRAEKKAEKANDKKAGEAARAQTATKRDELRETTGPVKVRATQAGYYGLKRQREGDVFTIANEAEFSAKWMERVSARTPEKTSTGQEVLNRAHAGVGTGGANPLGAE